MVTVLGRSAIDRMVAIGVLVVGGIFSGGSASAQLSAAWTHCANKALPDLQISGCTAVIQSGGETHKNRAIAYSNRGSAYQGKGDNDRAIADCDKAIALDPKLAAAYASRGNAYQGKKDYDRAIADYDKVIELDANSPPPTPTAATPT